VKRFDNLKLLKLHSAVLRTAIVDKFSLEWPQAPFLWVSPLILPGWWKRRHFAYIFHVADDVMHTDVHKALYAFYTKINCSILRQQSQKIRFVGSSSQVYCDKLQNRLSVDFSSRVLIYKEANCHGKTTIMSLFYLAKR